MNLVSVIGLVAAACTTISFLPQVIKTLKTKGTKDISLSMYIIFTIGISLWLAYGLMIKDLALILANGFTLTFAVIILILKIKYG